MFDLFYILDSIKDFRIIVLLLTHVLIDITCQRAPDISFILYRNKR